MTEKNKKQVNPIDNITGLLRIRVVRGYKLAIRDLYSSDPYVIIRHAKQKLKTRVIKRSLNPEWNEDLTLCIMDPNETIRLSVYDHDMFTFDDKMGDAEFDIKTLYEVVKMNLDGLPDGIIITKVKPTRLNSIAEESCVVWKDGKLTQNMFLRLRNVETGEIELHLHWIHVATSKSSSSM